ncbi:peptidoglycan-binding domain-containing protein [Streptomyces sp. SBT349]|uniref:peptidoglycan-binding domain-containing protein n=1 Tax=Streptomyces sp. SBT349 TaxID=1580539 RepID=UPI00069CFA9C|nr:peptidoglycan-binding domain-containing protein [Streptomyces sp. SBT349]
MLRSVLIALGAAAAVGVAAVAAGGFGGGDGAEDGGAPPAAAPATAEVTTATLTRSEEVPGALAYGDPLTVTPPAGAPGVLTWLPEPGDTVARGEPLYAVNAQPVPLLTGGQPLYRTLEPGAEGEDVELLERNLAELGYTGFTADDSYTGATAEAVAAWQDDLGRTETGTVDPGDAVVAEGAARVAQVHAAPGAPAGGGPLLDITGTRREIDVALDAGLEGLVSEGAPADVELPDGTAVVAEVAEIGAATAEQAEGGEAVVTVPLVLTVEDQEALGSYQAAPVTVLLTAERREDVLAVPVHALVALGEGGYGLEVVARDGTSGGYVRVTTGLFADGLVEVSGEGVEDGTVVGVPE